MKRAVLRIALGLALASGGVSATLFAQEDTRVLPTLLIRGDVVSLESDDPSAMVLTVKDRYGFETPIYLGTETHVTKGEEPLETSTLTPGTMVEVEYNFDVNTAKRHAVSVKVTGDTGDAVPIAQAAPADAVLASDEVASAEAAASEPPAATPVTPIEEAGPAVE